MELEEQHIILTGWDEDNAAVMFRQSVMRWLMVVTMLVYLST